MRALQAGSPLHRSRRVAGSATVEPTRIRQSAMIGLSTQQRYRFLQRRAGGASYRFPQRRAGGASTPPKVAMKTYASPTPDFRLQAPDSRLQTLDSRLIRGVISTSVEGVCEVGGWLVNFEPTPTKRGPGIGLACAMPHFAGDAKCQTSGSHLCKQVQKLAMSHG